MKIAVWVSGLIAKPLLQFVEEINARGVDVTVICSTSIEKQHVRRKAAGSINEVVSVYDVYEEFWKERASMDIEQVLAEAERNEAKYDVSLMEMLKADRHMARGFVKGAWFPRSLFSEKLNYCEYLDIINRTLTFFEAFFARHHVQGLLMEVASFHAKAACVVAKSKGIKVRIPHPSRVEDSYFFSHNEFIEYPRLDENYHRNIEKIHADPEKNQPKSAESYQLAVTEISGYLEYRSLVVTIKSILRQILVHIYQKAKGLKKYSPYYLRDRVRAVWLYHWGIKQADKQQYLQVEQYTQQKYIFYPLQLEPESATLVMSPEFDHQLYLVHLLASNLPAGWELVIKEHPLALGTRPVGFMESLIAYPNVQFASPFDSAKKWFLNSQAVAIITGTVGFEAAFDGIPVISFGKHNFITMLDYVFEVDSHDSVKKAMGQLSKQLIPDEKERKLQGYALEEALKQQSFPLDAGSFYAKKGEVKAEEMEIFVDQLIASLDQAL